MALLQKLKSILGLGGSETEPGERRDVGVTVEREADESASATTETAGTTTAASEDTGEAADAEASASETAEPDDAAATETAADTSEGEAATGTAGDEEDAVEPADDAVDESDDLEELKGVGPAYAQRLRDAGIRSVADLAEADADELAEETDLSPNRIGNWIEQAAEY